MNMRQWRTAQTYRLAAFTVLMILAVWLLALELAELL